jgi:tRNA A-37 threonylcarbamoyl transferase component Bud32
VTPLTRVTSDIPSDLSAALAARYALRDVLGRGGMATVYLADDRKHRRVVALKVLRPELAASIGSERFLHEIEIVAQLTHPHILSLHDSGEAGGFVYYVMPFIEGGSLRQRIEQNARMSVEEMLSHMAPVEDAVSYAHRQGLLHRDIKPENILFSQGHPIVADFGIARALISASETKLTRTGLALGTPGYMSPEQAAGFGELDERTDVYSMAVTAYEMLVGELPGCWPSEDAVATGRFLEVGAAHGARLTALGAAVEGALVRALAVRQEQRTATPGRFVAELRGAAAPPAPRRRYRADEVNAIVRRASELEASNPTEGGAMTIGGVEAIAREVGIAPELVRSAALSVGERAAVPAPASARVPSALTVRNRFIGGPRRIVFERVVPGELPESEFAVVVDEIRHVLRNVGTVSQLGRSFSWTMGRTADDSRHLEVVVTVRAGRTRITVQEDLGRLAGGVFGGICGGLGGGGLGPLVALSLKAAHLEPASLLLIIPAWLVAVFGVARTTYRYTSGRREKEAQQLIERLDSLVRELVNDVPRIGG